MEYTLKNGETLTVRIPVPEDVGAMVDLRIAMDGQTRFLGRNPGEFPRAFTVEKETKTIRSMPDNPNLQWFVAEYQGELVGRCAASIPSPRERFRHRGGGSFWRTEGVLGLGHRRQADGNLSAMVPGARLRTGGAGRSDGK